MKIKYLAVLFLLFCFANNATAQDSSCPTREDVIDDAWYCWGTFTGAAVATTIGVVKSGSCSTCAMFPNPASCSACGLIIGVSAATVSVAAEYCKPSTSDVLACQDRTQGTAEERGSDFGEGVGSKVIGGDGDGAPGPSHCFNVETNWNEWSCDFAGTGRCSLVLHTSTHVMCY